SACRAATRSRVAATASCTCCGICARTGRSPAPCPGLLIRAVCSVISSLLLGSLGSNPLCAFEAADYRIRTDKVDSNGLTGSRAHALLPGREPCGASLRQVSFFALAAWGLL